MSTVILGTANIEINYEEQEIRVPRAYINFMEEQAHKYIKECESLKRSNEILLDKLLKAEQRIKELETEIDKLKTEEFASNTKTNRKLLVI